MISREKFEFMKSKYGDFSSWAVWKKENPDKPTSNIGDLDVLDPDNNKDLLSILNPNVILVGLNISRGSVKNSLGNFHDYHKHGKDFKARFALRGTSLWGAYMTDILKDYDQKDSALVEKYLKENPEFEQKNISSFREELKDLGAENPLIVAFGDRVFKILERNLSGFTILKIPHYAYRVLNKEKYREQVAKINAC